MLQCNQPTQVFTKVSELRFCEAFFRKVYNFVKNFHFGEYLFHFCITNTHETSTPTLSFLFKRENARVQLEQIQCLLLANILQQNTMACEIINVVTKLLL